MMGKEVKYNGLRITVIVLLFIVSLNALAAGYSFISEPSGKGIGINTSYLRESAPFNNYLVPGIVLFTVIGICSSIIAVITIKKKNHYPLLIILQGAVYVGWIVVQLFMVTQFHILHAIIGGIGLLLMLIGWMMSKYETFIFRKESVRV